MKYNELTWQDINTIEKLINCVQYEYRNGLGDESFGKEVLKRFLEIKNDGSSEKPNNPEGLEDVVNSYLQEHRHDVLLSPYNGLMGFALLVCQWQKEQKTKLIPECLDEAAKNYAPPFTTTRENQHKFNLSNQVQREKRKAFKAGADWRDRMLNWARDLVQAGLDRPKDAVNILKRLKELI